MVALKASEVESFIARPDSARSIILVFGPDAGLVRERAQKLALSAVDDPNDPFSLVRLDGDELVQNPLRLVEEANTIPLFGGKRAIWLKAGSRNIVPAVETLLGAPSPDCRVVIEAGDLRRNAALRTLCERSKVATALPCYADSERDLARLIDEELRAVKLTIAPDARGALIASLGGDREASRAEIRKLALYAHGHGAVTLEDVTAVVSDASGLELDGLIDAAFAGKLPEVETLYGKARAEGTSPGAIVSAALRQVAQLHRMRLALDEGARVDQALGEVRPPVHFSRRATVETALRNWRADRLAETMVQFGRALLETRRQPDLAGAIAQRALSSVAVSARRKN